MKDVYDLVTLKTWLLALALIKTQNCQILDIFSTKNMQNVRKIFSKIMSQNNPENVYFLRGYGT